MKIAMLGTKGIPATWGGIERHVEELATRFVDLGHEVTIYCRSYYTTIDEEFYKGVHLRKLPTIKSKNLDAITHTFVSTLHLLFRDYDIVHYHAIGPATMAALPRFFGKKTVATVHGLDWQREKWGRRARTYLKFGERAAVWFPQATIVVSKDLKEYLEHKYHRQVHYIPNAASDPVFLKPNVIKQYGVEGGDYILFLARLVPEKGCHFLIEAFNRLKLGKKLVIAGGSSHSDEYVKKLQAMAGDDVIFTGYVHGEELQELYSNAYCCVLPSTIEGLPIGILEALAYGKCMIASDIAPNVEVAKDNGIYFHSKDVDDLERALRYAIGNPDLVADLGRKSKDMSIAEFSFDSIAEKTLRLYEAILSGNRYEGDNSDAILESAKG